MATWSSGISLRGVAGRSLRTGTGSPSNTNPTVQADGDSYLDLATGNIYAARTNGIWPSTPSANIVGATGPASIVTVTAPPGPNVGVVGGYAVWNNNGTVLLYGPKTSSGWAQTNPDAFGNQLPVSVQLTGAKGDTGTSGTNGLSVLFGVGAPAPSLGVVGQPGYIDTTPGAQALYAAKTASGWPTPPTPFYAPQILPTSGVPANTVGNVNDIAIDGVQGFVYGPKGASGWPTQPLVSTVGPEGPQGQTGPAVNLPNDYTANSFVVQPVSGDANTVQFAIKTAAGTVVWSADGNGNQVVNTLKATGASTLAAVSATSAAVSGNATVGGTLGAGATTVGSLGVTGGATIGTTLGVSGATTLAAVTASSASVSGNATVGGAFGVTGTSTLAAVGATNVTASGLVTAANVTLSTGGKLTYADGTTQATAASGSGSALPSRSIVHMGQITNTAINANAFYGLFQVNVNASSNPGANATIYGWAFKFPFAGAITAYQCQQNINAGSNQLQYFKNGTSIATITIGSGTGNFAGTHANTAYRFAAGDTLTCATSISSGSSTAIHVLVVIEWV